MFLLMVHHLVYIWCFDCTTAVWGLISPLSAKKAIWALRQKIRNARIQREVHKIKNQWFIRENHFHGVHICIWRNSLWQCWLGWEICSPKLKTNSPSSVWKICFLELKLHSYIWSDICSSKLKLHSHIELDICSSTLKLHSHIGFVLLNWNLALIFGWRFVCQTFSYLVDYLFSNIET